ncbi:MAG: GNAT family N-acetyltransferase [Acidimicrobiales bacterium]
MQVEVRQIPTAASYPLRHAVLRPQQDIEAVEWEGDEDPGTATFGAVEDANGTIVGVATVLRESAPFEPVVAGLSGETGVESVTWRLRGMATRADLRSRGIGSNVLEAVVEHVAAEGGLLLWCNARVSAIGFYERAGFRTWGDEFVVTSIGPHVVMWRRVDPERVK